MFSSVFVNLSSLRPTALRAITRAVIAAVAALGALGAPGLASAQTETFETKGYGGGCQNAGGADIGYIGDKEWAGFKSLDLLNYRTTCGYGLTNGYGTLGASVGNVLALGYSTAYVHSTNPFVLNSMVAGAGWQNPTSLKMEFFLNTVLLDTKTIQLNTYQTGLALYSGFYTGATDFIMFTPTYAADDAMHSSDVFNSFNNSCPPGSSAACVKQRYLSWFVDNVTFSTPTPTSVAVVPEPATVGMIGLGLLVVAVVGRKRRRAA